MTLKINIFDDGIGGAFERAKGEYRSQNIAQRLFARDFSLWSDSPDEIENRLGWLTAFETPLKEEDRLKELLAELKGEGISNVVLMGMGGSSLAPEVFALVFGHEAGLRLTVLDSVSPESIAEVERENAPEKTVYIVSSKSGSTIEAVTLMKHFHRRAVESLGEEVAARRFIAITTQGTSLVKVAGELGFRAVFFNEEDIGGRYAALSMVGMIPASLLGIETKKILLSGKEESAATGAGEMTAGALLGLFMGVAALSGRDKLVVTADPKIFPMLDWMEQLVAESTGKDGKGIVPVISASSAKEREGGADRFFVFMEAGEGGGFTEEARRLSREGVPAAVLRLESLFDAGAAFFAWEYATAAACWLLGVHPFNQPDVEAAKKFARAAMEKMKTRGGGPKVVAEDDYCISSGDCEGLTPVTALDNFVRGAKKGDYIGVHAYVARNEANAAALEVFRTSLERKTGLAVTVGFGPRFLHSTGQLHKGGPQSCRFIQIISRETLDIEIPGEDATFGQLKAAQCEGDRLALKAAGRKVISVELKVGVVEALARLGG